MKHQHHHAPAHHVPPHEQRKLMRFSFEPEDIILWNSNFEDENAAALAASIIADAPPESQVVITQLMKVMKEVA